jgi:imidazolonepropionase-like amidohydrolase
MNPGMKQTIACRIPSFPVSTYTIDSHSDLIMTFRTVLISCVLVCCALSVSAQQVLPARTGVFALTNATIETVTKGTLQGTVLMQNGVITGVGSDVQIPADAIVIDCTGKTVYPGMIDAGTQLGLSEIGSISLTQDANELGNTTPHVKALTAINPNSVLIPVARVNGITTVIAKPTGGLFPGTAALIHLHGYTPDQMYAGFEALVMNFPSSGRRNRFDRRSDEEITKESEKAIKRVDDIWSEALLYARIDSAGGKSALDYQPEIQALQKAVKGEMLVMIEADKKEDILAALKWIKAHNVHAVLTGVTEGWRVADSIAAAGVPVITGPVLATPGRSSDRYDVAYANAGKMHNAGVKVALRTNETENVRNLPYQAGFAATYGMGREAALRAVTSVPAEIFGVSDKLGSIEIGKVANVFVADGDPFETKTTITHLFIRGWQVPLESRHTLLNDEFLDRQPGLNSGQ